MKRDELRVLLEGAGIRPRRSSGQNFLIEENMADAIARAGAIEPDDVVLEIGTGVGILTRRLVAQAHHVVSVERDARVYALADSLLGEERNLTLLECDALANKNQLNPVMVDAMYERSEHGARGCRVVANLPYNVATSLVVLLLAEELLPLRSMVVMVQFEAAERFAARRGDAKYGAVSVLCSALAEEIRVIRKVPRDVFMPRPKVTSAVIKFTPRPERLACYSLLSEVVRALFNYRRKTLPNAAKLVARRHPHLEWLVEAVRTQSGWLDPQARPEDLDLEAFVRVTEAGQKAIDNK